MDDAVDDWREDADEEDDGDVELCLNIGDLEEE
jgi:hypothetical protein